MEKYTLTLGNLIENNVNIFDFEYPFYSEDYKPTFEKHFIDYFYYDEIGLETVARFKHRLKIKFNMIMPYWNKIFLADNLEQRILDNYDVTETYERDIQNKINTNNESNSKNLFSETPNEKVDFNNVDYASTLTKDIGTSTSDTVADNKEKWTRKMQGNIGVQTDADAIMKYWQSLRKIEEEIFKECDDLFMGVH